jgi:UDP-N-acetylglucosamine/UDP-N-acetylgalactosamine diphosphorylase
VLFVDNPLADPFDATFIGFTAENGLDIGMKVVHRLSLDEKMGLVVQAHDRLKVVEYSEFSPEDSSAYPFASPGLFCFRMDFIPSLHEIELPLHLARKKVHDVEVFKFETFQFDLLDYTSRSAALLYPRERTYAPLKNATGEKSIQTVREALQEFDRQIYTERTGLPAPTSPFELNPHLHYSADN